MSGAYEAGARTRKAFALSAVLDRVVGGADLTAGQVESLSADFRRLLAVAAGVNPPSDATWAVLVEIRRYRADVEARFDAAFDPFEGLPS